MPVYPGAHNTHGPHRSLDQQPPLAKTASIPAADHEPRVRRRDRLGGLLHEYELAA
jgi:putative transposase